MRADVLIALTLTIFGMLIRSYPQPTQPTTQALAKPHRALPLPDGVPVKAFLLVPQSHWLLGGTMSEAARSPSSVRPSSSSPASSSALNSRCKGCQHDFPSRNAVFKHLQETQGACLTAGERDEFLRYALIQQRHKVLVLLGYYIEPPPAADPSPSGYDTTRRLVANGEDAAQLLLQVLVEIEATAQAAPERPTTSVAPEDFRLSRAYGSTSRGTSVVAQDDGTGALTEVLALRLPALTGSVNDWIETVNAKLLQHLEQGSTAGDGENIGNLGSMVRVLGRLDLPNAACKFNPEQDYTHRRIEFLLPMDVFWPASRVPLSSGTPMGLAVLADFFGKVVSFDDGSNSGSDPDPVHFSKGDATLLGVQRPSRETLHYMHSLKKQMQLLTTHIEKKNASDSAALQEKEGSNCKRGRHRNASHESNKKFELEGRKRKKNSTEHNKELVDTENASLVAGASTTEAGRCRIQSTPASSEKDERVLHKQRNRGNKGTHILRRRRFHNFTPTVMAHEYLAFRRLDRFYHRATIRFEPGPGRNLCVLSSHQFPSSSSHRPFMVVSLNGDLFLNGQAPRLVGLFLALAAGVIDADIVDCVFDEKYPHLVPTPAAPLFAMHAAEACYTKWEGKLKAVLSPRRGDPDKSGWNDPDTLQRVRDWTSVVRERTAQAWSQDGVDPVDGRLVSVRTWVEKVLLPWAVRANNQLVDYRQWKSAQSDKDATEMSSPVLRSQVIAEVSGVSSEPLDLPVGTVNLPPLDSVDPAVPELFERVLHYLRQADSSGLWPSTTAKRQLVMISTVKEGEDGGVNPATATNLTVALQRANAHKSELTQSSAYIFQEGQGGASGSFSVGAMPGGMCAQPKGNTLFPELMKAAFELELALRPDREPSSTIAINRNAQFRPHTDSGAGVGQGTSLIVGLGTFVGGELVVEGELKDIRYKAVEFNGWKQRHWTMPFLGERYSLVWFTPKGCEGVRGLDLCNAES